MYFLFFVLALTPLSIVLENIPQSKNSNQTSEEPSSSPSTRKRNISQKKNTATNKTSAASTSQNELQNCPICSGLFPKDKIQVSDVFIIHDNHNKILGFTIIHNRLKLYSLLFMLHHIAHLMQ